MREYIIAHHGYIRIEQDKESGTCVTAYIPLGIYTVSLDSQVLQKNVYVDKNDLNVVSEENSVKVLPAFLLKVREKKVEIKKFGTTK